MDILSWLRQKYLPSRGSQSRGRMRCISEQVSILDEPTANMRDIHVQGMVRAGGHRPWFCPCRTGREVQVRGLRKHGPPEDLGLLKQRNVTVTTSGEGLRSVWHTALRTEGSAALTGCVLPKEKPGAAEDGLKDTIWGLGERGQKGISFPATPFLWPESERHTQKYPQPTALPGSEDQHSALISLPFPHVGLRVSSPYSRLRTPVPLAQTGGGPGLQAQHPANYYLLHLDTELLNLI